MASTVGPSIERKAPLILVVDDSEDLRDIYSVLLEAEGFRVATRGDGRRGVEAVVELRPDAVLLDMMMPEGDGLDFLRTLTARGLPIPPVVACSGYERLCEVALALGAVAFLLKPIDAADLLASLRAALRCAPAPLAVRLQVGHAHAGRVRAKRARDELLAQVDLEEPALLDRTDAVTRWLARFFDVTFAFVSVHLGSGLFDIAATGPGVSAKTHSSVNDAFCGELIDAGSTLLLEDASLHPCFSSHAAARAGTRFYAGAPMVTPAGLVLGTVCLTDPAPRAFRSEDMRILEHLGHRIGAHLAQLAKGASDTEFPITDVGGVDGAMFAALLTSELGYSARCGGAVGLAIAEIVGDAAAGVAVANVAGPPRLAICHRGGGAFELLIGVEDADTVRPAMSRVLEALSGGFAQLEGAGVAELRSKPAANGGEDDAHRLEMLASQACERSVARRAHSVDWVDA